MPKDTAHPIQAVPSLLDELGQADRLLGLIRAAVAIADTMIDGGQRQNWKMLTTRDAHGLEAVLSEAERLAETLTDGLGQKA